jgi:hypothetical protein
MPTAEIRFSNHRPLFSVVFLCFCLCWIQACEKEKADSRAVGAKSVISKAIGDAGTQSGSGGLKKAVGAGGKANRTVSNPIGGAGGIDAGTGAPCQNGHDGEATSDVLSDAASFAADGEAEAQTDASTQQQCETGSTLDVAINGVTDGARAADLTGFGASEDNPKVYLNISTSTTDVAAGRSWFSLILSIRDTLIQKGQTLQLPDEDVEVELSSNRPSFDLDSVDRGSRTTVATARGTIVFARNGDQPGQELCGTFDITLESLVNAQQARARGTFDTLLYVNRENYPN